MSDVPVLEATGLFKHYRLEEAEVPVLLGVDLTVVAGESVAVTGASGSGKSTLLHLLGGLDRPDHGGGHVAIDGVDLFAVTRAKRARIRAQKVGHVFQTYHLFPELTVLENIQLAGAAEGRRGLADSGTEKRALELLERVGRGDRWAHRPAELSGGEQQRVALVRAVLNKPRLLLADEPTGNLDSETGETVLEAMFELAQESACGIVLVTHDQRIAARCGRHERLVDGVLAQV